MANQEGSYGYTRDLSSLFDAVTVLVKDYLHQYQDRNSKVVEFHPPHEISQLVDLSLPEEGIKEEDIIEQCKSVLKYSVHTVHPYCFNQLFTGGVDQVGLLGQMLTSTVHTLMYTFEMAPVFTVMEAYILKKMRELVGWPNGDGDGIFTPGGSIANTYGLMIARYYKYPESKEHGIQHLPTLVLFASEYSHYSIKKSAIILGLGTESVIAVKCDNKGKMDPVDLDRKIEEAKEKGFAPFAVVGTSGTTVIGAYDPIGPIADVCNKHDLWLHIDAAFGGVCLISEKHRHLMANSERADSITWDFHKTTVVPQQCSAILLKRKGLLASCNSTKASYLFQKDKQNYDISYDTGDKSIQCGRVNDVFKLWLMWKAKGRKGFARQVENSIALAKYLAQRIKEHKSFELIFEPEYTNVCFWYIPPSLEGCSDSQERNTLLNHIAPAIKARLIQEGTLMIGYQPLGSYPNFFRMACIAPQGKESDMDFLLSEIERLGKDL